MRFLDALRGGTDSDGMRASLVNSLKRAGYVSSPAGERAMLAVHRELFVPEDQRRDAYDDRPLTIGYGQTISAPHMVAIMVEALKLRPGLKVLEIGAGSGYHSAVTAHMVVESLVEGEGEGADKGHIYTVEYVPELAAMAESNLKAAGLDRHVTVIHGDGGLGLPEHAPFDRVFVACAAPAVPEPLVGQMAEGGVLLIPVGQVRFSELMRYTKKGDSLIPEEMGGCSFVPLVGRFG